MKTLNIRLPDVEAVMLVEVQQRNVFWDISGFVSSGVRDGIQS